MPTFTADNTSVSAKSSEIITSALSELNVVAQGNVAGADVSAWGLEKLQRLIDRINARAAMIYNINFSLFTLPVSTQPITIGPTGVFDIPQRPIKIVSAALVLSSSPTPVDIPLGVRDNAWWAAQRVKSQTSTQPTDIFYSPDSPLGNIYPWPIPTQQNKIRIESWVNLGQAIALATAIGMPPAYWDYVVLTLARDLAPSFGQTPMAVVASPPFQAMHREALKAIQENNIESPRMSTAEAGQSPRSGRHSDFNYLTGQRS